MQSYDSASLGGTVFIMFSHNGEIQKGGSICPHEVDKNDVILTIKVPVMCSEVHGSVGSKTLNRIVHKPNTEYKYILDIY